MKKLLLALILLSACFVQVNAATIAFDLQGAVGSGLLSGNEPGLVGGGTGGEIGDGISYDDVSNLLTINVGWGSSQGFTDLSSPANNSHIHGPTSSVNGAGFTETAGVLFDLTRSSDEMTGGTFTNAPILLDAGQQTDLLNGKYYINLHTNINIDGEARGFLIVVPEPSTYALLAVGLAGLLALRRRKQTLG